MPNLRRCWFRGLTLAALLSASQCHKEKPPGALDRSGYHVRGSTVYFHPDWTSKPWVMEGVDIATFEHPLPKGTEAGYARDRQHVYWRGRPVPQADPQTFEILDATYARDATHVFRSDRLICDDSAHFEAISGNFVKNGHTVYALDSNLTPISSDPANFREFAASEGYSFCADKEQVFVNGNLISGADPATFEILGGAYTRDRLRLFYFSEPMPEGTVRESFQVLTGAYAKDQARVYHLGKLVEGADAATFVVTDDKFQKAHDAQHIYEYGKLIPDVPPAN